MIFIAAYGEGPERNIAQKLNECVAAFLRDTKNTLLNNYKNRLALEQKLQTPNIYFYVRDKEFGTEWPEKIRKELQEYRYALMLITRSATCRNWFYMEMGAFVAKKRFVPIIIETRPYEVYVQLNNTMLNGVRAIYIRDDNKAGDELVIDDLASSLVNLVKELSAGCCPDLRRQLENKHSDQYKSIKNVAMGHVRDFLAFICSQWNELEQHVRAIEAEEKQIHVIGWPGIGETKTPKEEETVENPKNSMQRYGINCGLRFSYLTFERSFTLIPHILYDERDFDIAIVDAELVENYAHHERIQSISSHHSFHSDCGTKLNQDITECVPNALSSILRDTIFQHQRNALRAVPLSFGACELLVHKERVWSQWNRGCSYKDFNATKMLREGRTIGLWGWFLPTMHHLLACQWDWNVDDCSNGPRNVVEVAEQYKTTDTSLQARKCVESIIQQVQNKVEGPYEKDKVKVVAFGSLKALHEALVRQEPDVVYGASSAVLKDDLVEKYKAVVPEEGIFLWVNCATMVNTGAKDALSIAPLVLRWWLSKGMQEQIALPLDNVFFRPLPINKHVLERIKAEGLPHPAGWLAERVVNEKKPLLEMSLRVFPMSWRDWHHEFARLCEACNGKDVVAETY